MLTPESFTCLPITCMLFDWETIWPYWHNPDCQSWQCTFLQITDMFKLLHFFMFNFHFHVVLMLLLRSVTTKMAKKTTTLVFSRGVFSPGRHYATAILSSSSWGTLLICMYSEKKKWIWHVWKCTNLMFLWFAEI